MKNFKERIAALILITIMLNSMLIKAFADEDAYIFKDPMDALASRSAYGIVINVNGKSVELPNGGAFWKKSDSYWGRSVFIPIDIFSNGFDYTIEYSASGEDSKARKVAVSNGKRKMEFTIGSKAAVVDGKEFTLSASPIVDGAGNFCIDLTSFEKVIGGIINSHDRSIILEDKKTGELGYSKITEYWITLMEDKDKSELKDFAAVKSFDGLAMKRNIELINTIFPTNTTYCELDEAGGQLSYSFLSTPNFFLKDSYMPRHLTELKIEVESSNYYRYECSVFTQIGYWALPEAQDNPGYIDTKKYVKEIIKLYFPKSHEQVYSLVDKWASGELELNTLYVFDDRQLYFPDDDSWTFQIGYIGKYPIHSKKTAKELKVINMVK